MISLLVKRFTDDSMSESQIRSAYGYVCGSVGIILNLILFAAKLFIGAVSGSISIVADAFNNLSDAGSSVMSLFGFILSGRKADKEHPFGHGRIEYIVGTLISAVIIMVGIELLKSSVNKILSPGEFVFNKFIIIILLLSVAVKLYMAYYNNACSKKICSASLKAVAADSISDAISTFAILLSSVFMYFTSLHIDGYVGCLVSILIIKTGIEAVIDTSAPLLGKAPDREFVKEIERIVRENPQTVGIHDLVVHDYGPDKVFVSLHMEVDGSKDVYMLHDAVDLVEKQIHEILGCEAVIHMDPIDTDNPILKELYDALSEKCSAVSEKVNIHDMRIVPGPTHTNVIFDLVLPPELFSQKEALCIEFRQTVQNINESYFAVITPEISYCG